MYVNLQIGQCGNQLGESFFNFLMKEISSASAAHQATAIDNFFTRKSNELIANSLLVDMEPKVVHQCLASKKSWSYDKDFSFVNQQGSGNNWAYGFNFHGPKCKEPVIEKISKMLEKLDFCDGFLMMQSLAGGTGSGLGSFLIEAVKDEYPEINVINIAVLPHLTGEVILQAYNTVLSVSNLYQHSDGIIFIENDEIHSICQQLLNVKNPTLDLMNSTISQQLCSYFFPVFNSNYKSNFLYNSYLQNSIKYISTLKENLLLDPGLKLLKITNVPQIPEKSKEFTNDFWQAITKRIFQMNISKSIEAKINWNIKNYSEYSNKIFNSLVIARGNDVNNSVFDWFFENKFSENEPSFYKDCHSFSKTDKSMTTVTNSKGFVDILEKIAVRAQKMRKENAYIYLYEKYGLGGEEIDEYLSIFEQILFNYQNN